jgi:hypothetical protein
MLELLEDGDSKVIVGSQIRLIFHWTGERWIHSIGHGKASQPASRILAVSFEGDSTCEDPSRVISPVYQQLHFQGEGAQRQALLVGQSGPHHFSAVLTFEEREGGDVSIDVDVADRCRGVVESLAATYTIDARSDDLLDADRSMAVWDFEAGRLTFAAVSEAQFSLVEAGRRATQIQVLAPTRSTSSTHRIRYQWHWQVVPFPAGVYPGRE